ncbi:MAG: MBL fold metallo-hydrolase [Promethearchaeota archaeon]
MVRLYRISKKIFTLLPRTSSLASANINILKTKKPALIDCGSIFDTNKHYISKILKSLGIQTINKIIITHSHIDHCQNAGIFAEHFGAEIFAHENAIPILKHSKRGSLDSFEYWELIQEAFPFIFQSRLNWLYRRLILMGYNYFVYRRGKKVKEITSVNEGDIINLGDMNLEVLVTPGHSNDSICLLEKEKGIIFTGDMIPWTPYIHTSIEDIRASISKILKYIEDYNVKVMIRGHQKPLNAQIEKNNYREFLKDIDIAEKRILKLLEHRAPLTSREMLPYIFRRSHFTHQVVYRLLFRTQLFWIAKYLQNLQNKNYITSFKRRKKTYYSLIK